MPIAKPARMDEVGEVALLRAVLPRLRQRRDVARGPGDDCAVLRLPGAPDDLLVTTDPVIPGHHYLPGTPLDKVARKAVGRALSDIAAMGGIARWILTDVTTPPGTPAAEIEALYAGLERAARRFGVSIVGGDLAEAAGRQGHIVGIVGQKIGVVAHQRHRTGFFTQLVECRLIFGL